MNKIIILNGPNLNLLGEREKNQYGSFTLKDIEINCNEFANKNNIALSLFQSNIEGEIIDALQSSKHDAIVLNAGGYTHTSVAIHDCVKAIKVPVIEVHISNIADREAFRHTSLISPVAIGCIFGFGLKGYELALNYFLD